MAPVCAVLYGSTQREAKLYEVKISEILKITVTF
jgi:hypothetical protein